MKGLVYICLLWAILWCGPVIAGQDSPCKSKQPALSPELHRVLVKTRDLWDKKKLDPALKALKQFAAHNPHRPHHLLSFWQGYLEYSLGRRKQAVSHLSRAVELWPCMAEAWRNLAVIRMEQKQPARAAELMLKAYHYQRPLSPELLYQAGVFYLMAKKPKQALPILERITARGKPKLHWLEALIRAHMTLKHFKQAQKVLDRTLSYYPDKERLWRTQAWLASERRDYRLSAAALQVACGLAPPKKAQWRQLGDLYRAARVPSQAAQAYTRAFGTHPKLKELDLLARTYFMAQMPEKALEAAQEACKRQPSPKRHALVGRIQMARRELVLSMKAYEKAAHMDKHGGQYWLMAGRLSWRLGSFKQAQKQFELALNQAKPGSGPAKAAKRALQTIGRYLEQLKTASEAEARAGVTSRHQ